MFHFPKKLYVWKGIQNKGQIFISNRQRRKEGLCCPSEFGRDRTHAARFRRAGYARLDRLATGGIQTVSEI